VQEGGGGAREGGWGWTLDARSAHIPRISAGGFEGGGEEGGGEGQAAVCGCHAQQIVVDQQRSADIRTHVPSNKQSGTAGAADARAPLAAPPPRAAPVVPELHAGELAGEVPLEKMARGVLQIELPRRDDVEVCDGAQSSNACAARQSRAEGGGWRGAAPSTAPLTTGCEKWELSMYPSTIARESSSVPPHTSCSAHTA
jgi:hypothetical protein